MWRPLPDLDGFNRVLVQLEQVLLSVFRGSVPPGDLAASDVYRDFLAHIDENPYQAVLMARIKSGHAMTPRHGLNVLMMARAWALTSHKLGGKLADFSIAALLHDLGHWRPDHLVYVFGPFTHEEALKMRAHAAVDDEGLKALGSDVMTWIGQHHEQPDGKGYPNGISNPHVLSQLLRIVDCFDGITTPRRFRVTWSYRHAMKVMSRWAGYKYSAGLFQSFRQFMGDHPVGSFVRIKDGGAGITLPGAFPQVNCLVLTNKDGDPLESPQVEVFELDSLEEAPQWQELQIPDNWNTIRPDLLGLPRFYGTGELEA